MNNVNMHYVNIIMQYLYDRAATEMKSVTPRVVWGVNTLEENVDIIIKEYGLDYREAFDFDEFMDSASFVDHSFEDLFDLKYIEN